MHEEQNEMFDKIQKEKPLEKETKGGRAKIAEE